MNYVKKLEKHNGVDIGYHNENLHPENGEGRVGKSGINKNFTLVQMIELAYKMEQKPNVLVKAGTNAKWYMKKIEESDDIYNEIEKQSWRDTTRCTMYIIQWE